jgi:hypothetical protein
MTVVAFTVMTALVIWLGAVYLAARGPRNRKPRT